VASTKSVSVTQFDHHGPKYAKVWETILPQMHRECPVMFSAAHGGMWVDSDYQNVEQPNLPASFRELTEKAASGCPEQAIEVADSNAEGAGDG